MASHKVMKVATCNTYTTVHSCFDNPICIASHKAVKAGDATVTDMGVFVKTLPDYMNTQQSKLEQVSLLLTFFQKSSTIGCFHQKIGWLLQEICG